MKKMIESALLTVGVAVVAMCSVQAADCAAYLRFFGALNGRVELNVRGEVEHYDDYGRYLGRMAPENRGEMHYYDEIGRYLGKSESTGRGTTEYYDDYGRHRGKSVRDGRTVSYYDSYGRYLGINLKSTVEGRLNRPMSLHGTRKPNRGNSVRLSCAKGVLPCVEENYFSGAAGAEPY